jgi:hypothetical protein
MDKLMSTTSGKGRELADLLRRELGVPDNAISFEVRFALNEVVTVKCEYMPAEAGKNG